MTKRATTNGFWILDFGIWNLDSEEDRPSSNPKSKIQNPKFPHPQRVRRGALLLEVVIALTIVVMALAIMGGPLVDGLKLTATADQQTRAVELGERLLAMLELDPSTAQRVFLENQTNGDFGPEHLGWFWRVAITPTEVEGLGWVTIDVLYQNDPKLYNDPDQAGLVYQAGMLKAAPGKLDINTDFGLDDDQIEMMRKLLADQGIDPDNLDPQTIANMFHVDTMTEMMGALLPLLAQVGGGALGGLGDLGSLGDLANGGMPSADQLADLMNQLQNGGSLPEDLSGLLDGGGLPGGQMPGNIEDLLRLRDQLGNQQGAGGNANGGNRGGRGGNNPVGPGASAGNGRQQGNIEDLIRLRDQMANQPGGPGGGNRNGAGNGNLNNGGRGGRGGAGNPGADAGNGGNRGGGNPNNGNGGNGGRGGRGGSGNPGANGGNGGNRGGGQGGSGGNNGSNGQQPRFTIEDLQNLRNQGGQGGRGGRNP